MEPNNKVPTKKTGIILATLVVVAIVLVSVVSGRNTPQAAPATDQTSSGNDSASTTTSQLPPADTGTTASSGSMYKDGTYTATGTYMSPGGEDHVGVTLTLANDIITDITVTPEPGDRTSAHYQGLFVSGYKQYVVGMNIADVHLSKVSGSSLTSGGFNDAIAQIEAQAQAQA